MGTQPMGAKVVPRNPTHGNGHSPFYEGNHGNDHHLLLPMGKHLVRDTIPQGNSLRNVVLGPEALHTDGRVYKVHKSTHLGKLKGSERSFQGNEIKNRRLRRSAEEKRT